VAGHFLQRRRTCAASERIKIEASASVISTIVIGLILLTTRQTLRPLNELADGLCRLQRGEFAGLSEIRVAELRQIGTHGDIGIARLGRSLLLV
jgi:nitrate/nitrite-specific signal transduction histidine kinase